MLQSSNIDAGKAFNDFGDEKRVIVTKDSFDQRNDRDRVHLNPGEE